MKKKNSDDIVFACFADGDTAMKEAGIRITEQAKSSNIFCKFYLYDKAKLRNAKELPNNVDVAMREEIPQFGWGVWKPIMIKLLLNDIPEGAILFYCDSGTEFVVNTFSKRRMLRVIWRTQKQPVIAFETKFPEIYYTKSKCLNLLENSEHEKTYQIETTTIILKNCIESRDFIDRWEDLSTCDDLSWIDDSLQDERDGFLAPRRDQSTFSILYKNAGYRGLKMGQVLGFWHEQSKLSILRRLIFNSFFLWQIRNRTGDTVLKKYQTSHALSFALLPLQYLVTPLYKVTILRKMIKQKLEMH
jgi:hypothetical protein